MDRCPKHDSELVDEKVKVTASHISWHPAYFQARNELFPMSYREVAAEADFALVSYCPKCREAEEEWGRTFDPMDIYRQAIENAKNNTGEEAKPEAISN